jgi:hypothetical protein
VTADTTLRPWLIIVHHEDDVLYQNLVEAFQSDPSVTVIKDRRRVDGRTQTVPAPAERRRSDRRRPRSPAHEKIWKSHRFLLIHRDETLTVYQEESDDPPGRAT